MTRERAEKRGLSHQVREGGDMDRSWKKEVENGGVDVGQWRPNHRPLEWEVGDDEGRREKI